jgi:hypothetical protein
MMVFMMSSTEAEHEEWIKRLRERFFKIEPTERELREKAVSK